MSQHRHLVFSGVLLLANRLQSTFDAQLDQLTLKQWLALAVLTHLPQPLPSTAGLAAALGTSHQNATKLVAALERKGFVALAPSPDDARARAIALTPHAKAYLEANTCRGEELLDELFAGLPDDDVRACLRVLDKMSRNLTEESIIPQVGDQS